MRIITDLPQKINQVVTAMESVPASHIAEVAAKTRAVAGFIQYKLKQLYPDNEHFDVKLSADSYNVLEVEIIGDQIGRYIYQGTAPHSITSGNPMPIGGGNFAMSVSHPGTKAQSAEIDAIINEGLAMLILGNSGWAL